MLKKREAKPFSSRAEKNFYESRSNEPVTSGELEFLKADMRHWIPEQLSRFWGLKVLDRGAGKAPLGALIARDQAPTLVVSLDLGFHWLQSATVWRQRFRPLSLVCGDAFALPFKDGAFDYVIANVFKLYRHHTPNEYPLRPQEIIGSFHRAGFQCLIKYFWRRWPALRHPIFSVAMSVVAQRL